MTKKLYTSLTAMEDFWKCPRMYYWKRRRKLERIGFHLPFFIGRLMGPAIYSLYEFPTKADKLYEKYYKDEVKVIRKQSVLSADNEEALVQAKQAGKGMMVSYERRYRRLIKSTKILKNEAPFNYEGIKGVVIVGKLDNIMNIRGKNYVHELKTTAILTPDYIKGIQTRIQPAIYLYCVNRIKDIVKTIGGKLRGAIFDVIKKPGIRQKKTESKTAFVKRLGEWYLDGGENKFHMEKMSSLLLSEDDVMNTLKATTGQIIGMGEDKNSYYQNFAYCCPSRGFPCDMYELCHGDGGEDNPAIMVQFKKKDSYRVGKL